MSESMNITDEFVSYLKFGEERGYDTHLITNIAFLRCMEERIQWDIDSCNYEEAIDDLKGKISELSSLIPHWNTCDIRDYIEQRSKELREDDDDETSSYTPSEYYNMERDNADIRAMFGSLKG
mgnify:FL=1